MVNVKQLIKNQEFKIVKVKIDGSRGRLVIDSRGALFAEIEKENIEDPEEFEDKIENYKEEFDKAIYKTTVRGNNYYLYEVYIDEVTQNFN